MSVVMSDLEHEEWRWKRLLVRGSAVMAALFAALFVVSLLGAWGAPLLAEGWTSYLGLVPLALGVREAVRVARGRSDDGEDATRDQVPGVWFVASVTLANGGDNIAVYVPVFANLGAGANAVVTATFATVQPTQFNLTVNVVGD